MGFNDLEFPFAVTIRTFLTKPFAKINSSANDLLAYQTFKTCTIKDWKLGAINYGLQLAIGIYIIYEIVTQQLYLKKTDVIPGSVRVSLKLPIPTTGSTPAYCNGKTQCLYWTENEMIYPSPTGSSVFIATRVSFQNSSALPAGCSVGKYGLISTNPTYSCTATANLGPKVTYYIANVESMTLNIDHSVRGQFDSPIILTSAQMNGKLQDASGNVYATYDDNYHQLQRSLNISGDIIPLKDILTASGITSLEDPSSAAGAAPGETQRGSGVVISMLISYLNRDSQIKDIKNVVLKYKYLPASIKDTEYKLTEILRNLDGSVTIVDRHGIFISLNQVGVIGQFNFITFLTNIVASFALLKIAALIVDLTMCYVLPRRERYKEVKYEIVTDLQTDHSTKADFS
ncbi:cytochrome c oxidase subunit 1 [Blyttiomyces sp. JEL0837]|nr:cytochrome c oxidase subunit 1 [Blyttiomyces sp. JEL0837]